jgi:DNA-3-methyladenine glycosylase II
MRPPVPAVTLQGVSSDLLPGCYPPDDRVDGDPYERLLAVDPVLRSIAAVVGRPDPFDWFAAGGTDLTNFAAMVLHIGSQQISTRAALAVFGRVWDAAGGRIDPRSIDGLGPGRLRALGLSGAKAVAIAGLARMHVDGTLDTDRLDGLEDDQVIRALTAARGVGLWTAQMFLIHQLRRPDVLPAGDLGIRQAVRRAWSWPALPRIEQVRQLGERWSPDRSYAAALLWASLHEERAH